MQIIVFFFLIDSGKWTDIYSNKNPHLSWDNVQVGICKYEGRRQAEQQRWQRFNRDISAPRKRSNKSNHRLGNPSMRHKKAEVPVFLRERQRWATSTDCPPPSSILPRLLQSRRGLLWGGFDEAIQSPRRTTDNGYHVQRIEIEIRTKEMKAEHSGPSVAPHKPRLLRWHPGSEIITTSWFMAEWRLLI